MSRSRTCSCVRQSVAPHFCSADVHCQVAPCRDAPSCKRILATARSSSRSRLGIQFQCPLLDRGYLGPSRRGLPESCAAGCQAGFPNHSDFTDPTRLGFIESVSVVCRRPTWPFDFGLDQMVVASTSPTMLIGLDTAGRRVLRAATPLRYS